MANNKFLLSRKKERDDRRMKHISSLAGQSNAKIQFHV